MKVIIGTVVLIVAATLTILAADPTGYHFWTHAELESAEKKLAPQMDDHKFKSDTLVTAGNHRFLVVHREATGESEYHENEADIWVITNGTGTALLGGEMVGGRPTGPGEIRGSSIRGAVQRKVGPGDVVHISAKVMHQMTLEPGKEINYFVIKVKE